MALPTVVRDVRWHPEQQWLQSPFLQTFWGQDVVQMDRAVDTKTKARLDRFADSLRETGQGFAGPFPLRLPKGWLLARWVGRVEANGTVQLTWLDLRHIPTAVTENTHDLRRWQLLQQMEKLPVLTARQREFLEASLAGDTEVVDRVRDLLEENSLLEFRLLASVNPFLVYGRKPLTSWRQVLMLLGASELVRLLQPLVLAEAAPAGSRLEETLQQSRFLLASFRRLLPPGEQGACLNLWLSALLFGGSLLVHYGHPDKVPLLRELEEVVPDVLSVQEFLYGMSALEVAEWLLQRWKLGSSRLDATARQWLTLAVDVSPGLRKLAVGLGNHVEDWMNRGLVLLREAEHPVWRHLSPLDKERFQAILDYPLR